MTMAGHGRGAPHDARTGVWTEAAVMPLEVTAAGALPYSKLQLPVDCYFHLRWDWAAALWQRLFGSAYRVYPRANILRVSTAICTVRRELPAGIFVAWTWQFRVLEPAGFRKPSARAPTRRNIAASLHIVDHSRSRSLCFARLMECMPALG